MHIQRYLAGEVPETLPHAQVSNALHAFETLGMNAQTGVPLGV